MNTIEIKIEIFYKFNISEQNGDKGRAACPVLVTRSSRRGACGKGLILTASCSLPGEGHSDSPKPEVQAGGRDTASRSAGFITSQGFEKQLGRVEKALGHHVPWDRRLQSEARGSGS